MYSGKGGWRGSVGGEGSRVAALQTEPMATVIVELWWLVGDSQPILHLMDD